MGSLIDLLPINKLYMEILFKNNEEQFNQYINDIIRALDH